MTPVILDASALLAVALDERGAETVTRYMKAAPGAAFIHAVNAFEVASKLMARAVAEDEAWAAAAFGGAITVTDAGGSLGRRASRLKTANPHLSLGDCFCLALTEEMAGLALTGDGGFAIARTSAGIVMIR